MLRRKEADPVPTVGELAALREALLATMERHKRTRAQHTELHEACRRLRRAAAGREAELLERGVPGSLAARRAGAETGLAAMAKELEAVEEQLCDLPAEEARARAAWRAARDTARQAALARLGARQRALEGRMLTFLGGFRQFLGEAAEIRTEAERWARETDGLPDCAGERFPAGPITTATLLRYLVVMRGAEIDGGDGRQGG